MILEEMMMTSPTVSDRISNDAGLVLDPKWRQVCAFESRADLDEAVLAGDGSLVAHMTVDSGLPEVMTASLEDKVFRPFFITAAYRGPVVQVAQRAFVMPWTPDSVALTCVTDGGQWKLVRDFGPVTAIGLGGVRDGRRLLAIGYADGRVSVVSIEFVNGLSCREVGERILHRGTVTAIAVGGDSFLASGGADRSIRLTQVPLDHSHVDVDPTELRLFMRCRGVKIEGLISDTERALLAEMSRRAAVVC